MGSQIFALKCAHNPGCSHVRALFPPQTRCEPNYTSPTRRRYGLRLKKNATEGFERVCQTCFRIPQVRALMCAGVNIAEAPRWASGRQSPVTRTRTRLLSWVERLGGGMREGEGGKGGRNWRKCISSHASFINTEMRAEIAHWLSYA